MAILLVLLICIISINCQSTQNSKNTGMKCQTTYHINNLYYSLVERTNLSGTPSDLRVRYKTKDVFYTFISKDMKMTLQIWHPTGYIENIQTKGLGQSTAIDNLRDIVYLATDNGVYKFNNGIHLYAAPKEDVMYIAVDHTGENLYIATWPHNRVHKISKNGTRMEDYPVIPNGRRITIDTKDNIYFDANKIWYVLKKGEEVPITIRNLPTERAISFDVIYSEVFAMDEVGNLYSVNADTASATFLGKLDVTGVNTFALDSNYDAYIGTMNEILKYTAYSTNECLLIL